MQLTDSAKPNVQLDYIETIGLSYADNPFTGLEPDFSGPYLPFRGTADVIASTHFSGDGFGGPGVGGFRPSIDTESLILNEDGSLWIGDEYAPSIYHFAPDGSMINVITLPEATVPMRNGSVSFSSGNPPRYDMNNMINPLNPESGRANNQGVEGITASPDGKTLWALMQSALVQDGGLSKNIRYSRLFKYDISDLDAPRYDAEYVVQLPTYSKNGKDKVAKQSEIHFISDTQFFVLARDNGRGEDGPDGPRSKYRHVDVFDISEATNIKGKKYDCSTCAVASAEGELKDGIEPAEFCPFLDLINEEGLNRFGLHNGGKYDTLRLGDKWESLALVPVLEEGGNNDSYFLISLGDNDFVTQDGYMNGGRMHYSDGSGHNVNSKSDRRSISSSGSYFT